MEIRARHWCVAFICAVALQVGAAVTLLPARHAEPLSAGNQGIDISLTLAGPVRGGDSAAAELEPLSLPEPPALEPLPQPEPLPEPKPAPTPKPVATPQPPQPPIVPATRTAELAEIAVPSAVPPASMLAAIEGADRDRRESATGARRGGGAGGGSGSGSARQSYYGQLAAALNRHKRYPYAARKARQEGVVKVRFVIDAQGQVLERDIEASSGYRALDKEVIAMVERASPLPAIPAELGRTQLAIVLPIEFSLRHR